MTKVSELAASKFAGPLALGMLDHSNQSSILGVLTPPLTPPRSCPGSKSRCAVAKLWLSRGSSMMFGTFWSHPERFLGLHVGSCWLMLVSCRLQVVPNWLQDGPEPARDAPGWPFKNVEKPLVFICFSWSEGAGMAPRWPRGSPREARGDPSCSKRARGGPKVA